MTPSLIFTKREMSSSKNSSTYRVTPIQTTSYWTTLKRKTLVLQTTSLVYLCLQSSTMVQMMPFKLIWLGLVLQWRLVMFSRRNTSLFRTQNQKWSIPQAASIKRSNVIRRWVLERCALAVLSWIMQGLTIIVKIMKIVGIAIFWGNNLVKVIIIDLWTKIRIRYNRVLGIRLAIVKLLSKRPQKLSITPVQIITSCATRESTL